MGRFLILIENFYSIILTETLLAKSKLAGTPLKDLSTPEPSIETLS